MRTIRGGSPQALRLRNKELVIEELLKAPQGLTRPDLASAVGLTVPGLVGLVTGRESLEAIVDVSDQSGTTVASTAGPVPKIIRLKDDLGVVIGIDLSHTQIEIAIADLRGAYNPVHDTHVEAWDVETDLHGAFSRATSSARELAEERGITPERIAGIGLGIAAPVNAISNVHPTERSGRLRVDLGGPSSLWSNIDPLAAMTNHLAGLPDGDRWRTVPLHIDNDANLGALAELKTGAARGRRNVLYVHLDEAGVGSGLVFEGQIYRGSGGIAGELGHVVLDPNGQTKCPRCGRSCVESTVLSMLGYRNGSRRRPPLRQLVESALDGNISAQKSIANAAEYIGQALASFVTLLNFDRVVIGGPFPPQAYRLIIPPMQNALSQLIITPAAKDYVMQLASSGEHAVLDGAVWLALERTRVDYLIRYARDARHATTSVAP